MPYHYESNTDDVTSWITDAVATFGFTSTHEGRALGEILVDEVVSGISDRSASRQCGADGEPWPVNSRARKRMKEKRDGYCLTNYDTGQMLSVPSLRGTVTMTDNLIVMEYGTGEAPDVPDRLPASQRIMVDGEVAREPLTDVDKAVYAAEQGRGFYELDDTICDNTFSRFSEALGAHLANRGR